MKFLKELFTAYGKLLLKLASSRKAFFQVLSKCITLYLIINLKNELYITIIFALSTIGDWVYMNEINFEPVKTNININK